MKLPLELALMVSSAIAAPLTPRSAAFPQLTGLTSTSRDLSTTDTRFPQKYFHESIYHPHYDGRFADSILPRKTRLFHMRLLLRSYMAAMERAGIRAWIMHGSLLGWWWNRGMFPWDSDLDVCVEETGMAELGAWWNMTVQHFTADDLGLDDPSKPDTHIWHRPRRGGEGELGATERLREPEGLKSGVWDKVLKTGKKYLLEVNAHFTDTSTNDRHNVIDARWIDTSTGLFIDITTVHSVPSSESTDSGEMYTKDTHLYTTSSLFPLREARFEGTRVFVPYAYEQLLVEEYGPRSLTETRFGDYQFNEDTKEWALAPAAAGTGKGKGDKKDAAGWFRKGGKKPKWKPADDKERNKKDNAGGKAYTPSPGRLGDVHVVPGRG